MAAAVVPPPSDGSVFLTTTATASTSYLTPATYDDLMTSTLSLASNPSAIMAFEGRRAQACGLIAAVGAKVGLPQRTIDTAFVLWHKFGLYHGASSGNAGQHVAQAALFLACKLNDTPKKTRELILASYPLRYPELVKAAAAASVASNAGGSGGGAKQTQQNPALAILQETDVDSQLIESERNKILHLERTMLDSLGYDFKIRQAVESVSRTIVKLGKAWAVSRAVIESAWRVASDIHRTPCPLIHTPVTIALASLLAAALLWPSPSDNKDERSVTIVKSMFGLAPRPGSNDGQGDVTMTDADAAPNGSHGNNGKDPGLQAHAQRWLTSSALWERELGSYAEGVEEVVHSLLDLYISSASTFAQQQAQHLRAMEQHAATTSSPSTTTPSPASPLNPSISPSSPSEYYQATGSGGSMTAAATSSSAARKQQQQSLVLPPYAVNPPPLGIIDCFAQHRRSGSNSGGGDAPASSSNGNSSLAASVPGPSATSISATLVKDLTDVKIRLRQVEDARREQLAGLLSGEGSEEEKSRLRRLRVIDEEKRRVQTLRIQVAQAQNQRDATSQPGEATATVGGTGPSSATQTPVHDLSMPPPPVGVSTTRGMGGTESQSATSGGAGGGAVGTTTARLVIARPAGSIGGAAAMGEGAAPSSRPVVKTARFLF